MGQRRIHPVVLCGGSGTRLWPLSRALYPKQLLALASERTLLQDTLLRTADPNLFAPPLVVGNEEHRFVVAEQLRTAGIEPEALILEPAGRNTAPAAAVAALLLSRDHPAAHMLVMPADHVIGAPQAFLDAVSSALRASEAGKLVTFGITPTSPHTGYGYIHRGDVLPELPGCRAVSRFVEKPDAATAAAWVTNGEYLWNSGIFLFPAARYLAELEQAEPAIVDASRRALDSARRDLSFLRLDAAAFGASPANSIDYAVMERAADAVVVPVEVEWRGVGELWSLWEVSGLVDAEDGRGGEVLGGDRM